MLVDEIINKYYLKESITYHYLVVHANAVTQKALEIAENNMHLNPDLNFIREAAMLHDIGIYMTRSQKIACNGSYPYIAHGYLGREILDKEGFPKHALVCERHVGVGISLNDINKNNLPLPKRDMLPVTIEEKIICLADEFFSKSKNKLTIPKSITEIKKSLSKYGEDKIDKFMELMDLFQVDKK